MNRVRRPLMFNGRQALTYVDQMMQHARVHGGLNL
ncbi:hypothetical protein OPKNFCMD_6664 [Methylobacterium crusticola]|uniref:Uncharacterized protein n=1 Tax=Methylobacterium crusticola TaxID=1697972 RepID=A0ABQ4R9N2_9HYPH|nr:hypothetical protein OPKNFCMD_6664 [Methylobacterium crusticola]